MSSLTKNTNDDCKKEDDERNGSSEQSGSEKDSPKKGNKTVAKSPQKNKKVEDNSEEESEEDEDRKPGLLDLPLEVSGARERKKVERLDLSFNQPTKERKTDFVEGFGHKLGDCPRIEIQLQKFKIDDLKPLHRLIYNRLGATHLIKKNLRKFNGFPFDKDSTDFERKKSNLDRSTIAGLKKMCELLDLEKGGTKEDLISRIMEFLLNPQPSGKAIQKTKKRKPASSTTRKSKTENKRAEKNNTSEKNADRKEESSKSEGGSDANEEGSEDSDDQKKSDDNDTQQKTKPMAEVKRRTDKKKTAPKKVANKTTTTKGNKRKSESSDDDDEPLVKIAKQPPTDDELKSLIKSILDGANLEEITMKTVCKQVYAKFPEFDLSQRKEFIKTTVKSIIS